MKLLFYSTDYKQAERLRTIIENKIDNVNMNICRNFDHLDHTLRTVYFFSAVVLMVTNKEELLELLTIQKMLERMKIILILPDDSDYFIKTACKLYPRFLTESGQNLMEIADVLNKIAGTMETGVA